MMLGDGVSSFLGWLLDLDRIRLGDDAPVMLSWHWVVPAWVVVPSCLILCLVVFSIGRRERRSEVGRFVGTWLRVLSIVVVFLLFSQPVIVLQRERVEPAHVAVVIDTSASMGLVDGDVGRLEAVRSVLVSEELKVFRALLEQNEVRVYSFSSGISEVGRVSKGDDVGAMSGLLGSLKAEGGSTDLSEAMRGVFSRDVGRVAAAIVLSDGRCTGSVRVDEVVAEARSRRVPVHAVLMGSPVPRGDVFVGSVVARESVFLRDSVAVHVEVGSRGLSDRREVGVRLFGTGDQLLAEEVIVIDPDEAGQAVALRFVPSRVGEQSLRVVVAEVPGELDVGNNVATLSVKVVDRQMRVLYVDGYPRYEYRYLKNALLREPTIRSSCLLLSADAGFAQEGTDPIDSFPATMEALDGYDVVVLGDVDLTDDRLGVDRVEMLRGFVGDRGGGVVFMAGPESMPFVLRGSELESLLPVRLGAFDQTDGLFFQEPVGMRLTVDGRDDGLFRLGVGDDVVGVADWSGAHWVPPGLEPKAGATVLAERVGPGGSVAAVVRSRFGAGRVLYLGTDETWRWRSGGNDWLFDAFWLQVCRAMAGPDVGGAGERFELTTDRRGYSVGEDVQVTLSLWGAGDGLLGSDSAYRVVALDPFGDVADEVWLRELGNDGRIFEGSFLPNRSGDWRLVLEDAGVEVGFRVSMVDAEMERPEADHETLRAMAALTGGCAVGVDELLDVAGGILDRSVSIPDDVSESLWDTKLAFLLFGLLVSAEWICRKAFGMV